MPGGGLALGPTPRTLPRSGQRPRQATDPRAHVEPAGCPFPRRCRAPRRPAPTAAPLAGGYGARGGDAHRSELHLRLPRTAAGGDEPPACRPRHRADRLGGGLGVRAHVPHTLDTPPPDAPPHRREPRFASGGERSKADVQRAIIRTKHRRSDLARLNDSLALAESFLMVAKGEIELGRMATTRRCPTGAPARALEPLEARKDRVGPRTLGGGAGRLRPGRSMLLEGPSAGGNDEDLRRTAGDELLRAGRSGAGGRSPRACCLAALRSSHLAPRKERQPVRPGCARARALLARGGGAQGRRQGHGGRGALARARRDPGSAGRGQRGQRAPCSGGRWPGSTSSWARSVPRRRAADPSRARPPLRTAEMLTRALLQGEPSNKSYALTLCRALAAGRAAGTRSRKPRATPTGRAPSGVR